MRRTNARRFAWGAAVGAVLLAAVPALSAARVGAIELASLTPGSAVNGIVPIDWTWSSGSVVQSTDLVNVFVRPNGGSWQKIAHGLSIRDGGFDWDTTGYADAPYTVRVKIISDRLSSTVAPVYLDNEAPIVSILRPNTGQISIDDQGPGVAIVAGTTTLEVLAVDALSGVESVTWILDRGAETEKELVSTPELATTYDFSEDIGPHTLTAVATDFAGNEATDSVDIVALPGAAYLGGTELPEPPAEAPEAPVVEEPDLGELPDLGDPTSSLPDPGEVPNPDDLGDPTSDLPNPDDLGDPTGGVDPDDPTKGLPVGIPTP